MNCLVCKIDIVSVQGFGLFWFIKALYLRESLLTVPKQLSVWRFNAWFRASGSAEKGMAIFNI